MGDEPSRGAGARARSRKKDPVNETLPYLILSAVIFGIGVVGFLSRRNMIVIFLSTEIMFQGVVLNLVAWSRLHRHVDGQVFALFLLAIAAVEAGLALGLIVLLYRRKGTLDSERWASMSG